MSRVSGILDFILDVTVFNCPERSAHLIDFVDVRFGLGLNLVRQVFHHVGTCEWINGIGHPGLVGDNLLRPLRDLHRFFGWEPQRLIHAVGMQGLRTPHYRGQSLQRDAHHIVFRLLRRQR